MTNAHGWRMATRAGTLVVLAGGMVSGCSEEATPSSRASGPDPAPSVATAEGPSTTTALPRERVVHVRMSLEIDGAVARTLDALRDEVTARDGYLESSARVSEDWADLEIRVPAGELGALRAAIAERGTVTRDTEETEDVTFARIDLDARLGNAREEERRLLALYADRTATLADVLAVEHELSRVRGEVERLDAEARALADRVAMARISLSIARAGLPFTDDPLGAIATAGASGLRAAWTVAVGAVVVSVAMLPSVALVLLVLALAWLGLRRLRRAAP